ncbi:MAG: tetratricopeptide repeat protein [Candidatus Omnitrophota bacterium]
MRKFLIVIAFLVVAVLTSVTYHITQRSSINYHIGRGFFTAGQYRKAIPFFATALEEDPSSKKAARDLGLSYLWTEAPEKAAPLLQETVDKDPENASLLEDLADAYAWSGEHDAAIGVLREKLRFESDFSSEKKLAEMYLWSKRYGEAETLLRAMASRYPEDKDVLLLLGRALYYSGNSKEASKVLEKLLEVLDE